ncbi:MAG: VWA domain-containing protein [Pseudomonadota bacterium]
MRRLRRPPIEVFNLAFLDIISCAFGAVIMLVLLAKNGEQDVEKGPDNLSTLIEQVLQAQQDVETLQGALSDKQQQLAAAQSKTASELEQQQNLDSAVPRAQQTVQQLKDKASSLRKQIREATAMLNTPNSTDTPDDDVGGIPTDAEYVIFAIDNSGSMSGSGWNRVISVVNDILKNHPQMKGFQIMSADGGFMFSSQKGKWLSDRASMRQTAIQQMSSFRGGASKPEAGILTAINLYKNTPGKVSLYVFGDDYRPSNLEQTVRTITQKNAGANGSPVIRIHGIGFLRDNGDAERFAAFMQAVAQRNRGAFVGLEL